MLILLNKSLVLFRLPSKHKGHTWHLYSVTPMTFSWARSWSIRRWRTTTMTMMISSSEKSSEAMSKTFLLFLIFLFNNLFDFQQIMLMINGLLTILAKTKLRARGALVSYSSNGLFKATFAFITFMNNRLMNNLLRVSKLLSNTRHQCFDSLIN